MASVAYIFCSLRATPVAALYIHRRKKLSFFLSDYSSVDFVSILGYIDVVKFVSCDFSIG
ncbi:unnamed protein product [Arabidopsis lyrata]|nr:unnamed protein product [Arabidopsis lyrata]